MRRNLIENNAPPEWNIRVFTEDDLHYYCDQAGIEIIERPLEQPGTLIPRDDGKLQLFLNSEMRGAERLFVALHELGHHFLHSPGIQFFLGWDQLSETEADIFAACAMIPITVLKNYWPSEVAELYGYPSGLVDLRWEIWERWGI